MSLALKPTHAAIKTYYAALHQVGQLHFNNEAQVSDAFAKLLADCGRKLHLTFIPQFPIQLQRARRAIIRVDGALLAQEGMRARVEEAEYSRRSAIADAVKALKALEIEERQLSHFVDIHIHEAAKRLQKTLRAD